MYFVSAQHLYLFACCVLYFCPPASKRYRNLLTSLSKTHLPKGEQEGRREREGERLWGSAAVRKGGVMRARESDWGGLSRNQREYCSSCSDSPCCYRCSSAASLSLSFSHARWHRCTCSEHGSVSLLWGGNILYWFSPSSVIWLLFFRQCVRGCTTQKCPERLHIGAVPCRAFWTLKTHNQSCKDQVSKHTPHTMLCERHKWKYTKDAWLKACVLYNYLLRQ